MYLKYFIVLLQIECPQHVDNAHSTAAKLNVRVELEAEVEDSY